MNKAHSPIDLDNLDRNMSAEDRATKRLAGVRCDINADSNTGPATETIVAAYPAYAVVRRTGHFGRPVEITSTDRLGLKHEDYYREYSPGSVVSYALKCGLCPIDAVARATKHGHGLHWINGCSISISSMKKEQYRLIEVAVGMVVLFEGRVFEITAERNDNLGLKFLHTL